MSTTPPKGQPKPRPEGLMRIDSLMDALAKRRPVFHGEADFQHALAWELHEVGATRIRLERYHDEISGYLDLEAQLDGQRLALELKYWTRKLEIEIEGEQFRLKNQGAHDISRYDFVKDVTRVEKLVASGAADIGYAIALTNDHGYWKESSRETIDRAFRLHEGRTLAGELAWSEKAGQGTTKNRETPLILRNAYTLDWRDYSSVDSAQATFRYLVVGRRGGD